jgi:hypothetical protein
VRWEPLLGLRVLSTGKAGGAAERAGRALHELGALVTHENGHEVIQTLGDHRLQSTVCIKPITSVWKLRPRPLPSVASEYIGLRAASELLQGGARSINSHRLLAELVEGIIWSRPSAQLLRFQDGWVVARWRDEFEPALLKAMTRESQSIESVWQSAREARLLVAPVQAASRSGWLGPRLARLGRGAGYDSSRRLRVIDWAPLWAGPWAAGKLAARGADVVRIESPHLRDGFSRTKAGRERWLRWNGQKRLLLADATTIAGFEAIAVEIERADLLISGYSARVLPQLGFDHRWFVLHAPRLFHISLCAYAPPWSHLPGLGDQAAAVAGLLWRGPTRRPAPPYPWADPILAAWTFLVSQAWVVGEGPAGSLSVSLETAARRAATLP